MGNRGFRKYLSGNGSKFQVDEKKIKEDARYDGKWVLRTNTDLGKHFLLRSEAQGVCGRVFAASGVALPPTVQQIKAS